MRICLVSQEYPPETGGGGIGTQTYLKAHGLAARGHEIHVVSASWDREERTYRDGLASIHRIAEPELAGPGYETSTYWIAYSMAVAVKLHALSQQTAFDVIQFPEYGGEGFIYQTDTFGHRTAAYVLQLHGPLSMFADHMAWPDIGSTLHRIGCFMERTVIHHADRVLASSHNTAAYCAQRYDYPLERIHVIHSGIDTSVFHPTPPTPGEHFPKLLFVGNFSQSKGLEVVVDAVIGLRGQFPRILARLIGKGDDDYVAEIQARIHAARADACFDIKRYVPYEELPDQYAWCDIFVGPSAYEPGPGNVYIEAMASGRPVIACNTAGTPEVVLDGCTGLLVAPDDVPGVAAAIGTLATDHALRASLGRNGHRRVHDCYSAERYLDKVEKVYRDVVDSRV